MASSSGGHASWVASGADPQILRPGGINCENSLTESLKKNADMELKNSVKFSDDS